MSEPTGILTFGDLITEVAEKIGLAFLGDDGTEEAQVPRDAHDLALCKGLVNKALRMFIHDAPQPNGWRWLRPVASLVLWPSVDADDANVVTAATYSSTLGTTSVVVTTAAFYPSMELKTVTLDATDYTIVAYVSSTVITVAGDASSHVGDTFAVAADGNYTLPSDFGGQFLGHPTFSPGTNRGFSLEFVDESVIRERRANVTLDTGIPLSMAVQVMSTGSPRRRWEALFHPTPGEVLTIQFPYVLHFQKLVTTSEVSPAPFGHDETIKAACRAIAEKDVEDALGMEWQYYRSIALPNSYRVDSLSAPKKLGYMNNGSPVPMGISTWRDLIYQRPTVTVN